MAGCGGRLGNGHNVERSPGSSIPRKGPSSRRLPLPSVSPSLADPRLFPSWHPSDRWARTTASSSFWRAPPRWRAAPRRSRSCRCKGRRAAPTSGTLDGWVEGWWEPTAAHLQGCLPAHCAAPNPNLNIPTPHPPFPQAVLKASGPGPECINGRLAMLAILGTAGVELATERTLLEQLSTPLGAAAAVALAVAVAAASLVPLLLGKVRPAAAFPSDQASYADTQLPYFWTALAETMNGRVAMVGLVGLVVTELIRGAPVF